MDQADRTIVPFEPGDTIRFRILLDGHEVEVTGAKVIACDDTLLLVEGFGGVRRAVNLRSHAWIEGEVLRQRHSPVTVVRNAIR
jgi:hypothetical protein